jgi:hypothetical protein
MYGVPWVTYNVICTEYIPRVTDNVVCTEYKPWVTDDGFTITKILLYKLTHYMYLHIITILHT